MVQEKVLSVSQINWNSITSYEKLQKTLNGAVTTLGFAILKFKSSPVLSAYTIIMSKYMNCQNDILILMAIVEITDGKLDSLFHFRRSDKDLVTEHFKGFGVNGSDHLTILNIYKSFASNNSNTESSNKSNTESSNKSNTESESFESSEDFKKKNKYLNLKLFRSIKKRIEQLTIYVSQINESKYEYINSKYDIIKKKPYSELQNNLYYVLGMSHYFNMLTKSNKTSYKSINYLHNTNTSLEFSVITPVNKHEKVAICNSLSNAFGRESFSCITLIPDNIVKDMIENEQFNFDHKIKLKELLSI
jgi:hypothetical protein